MLPASRQPDLRNSVRFPLHLPVTLKTPHGEIHAKTADISAGGMRFHTKSSVKVGATVEFVIEMPAEMLGTSDSVAIICTGRVVRCLREASEHSVAVVIDEYHFQRLQRTEGH